MIREKFENIEIIEENIENLEENYFKWLNEKKINEISSILVENGGKSLISEGKKNQKDSIYTMKILGNVRHYKQIKEEGINMLNGFREENEFQEYLKEKC